MVGNLVLTRLIFWIICITFLLKSSVVILLVLFCINLCLVYFCKSFVFIKTFLFFFFFVLRLCKLVWFLVMLHEESESLDGFHYTSLVIFQVSDFFFLVFVEGGTIFGFLLSTNRIVIFLCRIACLAVQFLDEGMFLARNLFEFLFDFWLHFSSIFLSGILLFFRGRFLIYSFEL